MSKKNSVLKFGIFSAFLGGAYALTNYIYKLTSVPVQHTDESPDYDKAITAGRMFVRNHKDKQDMYINSIDQLKLHAAYIPVNARNATVAGLRKKSFGFIAKMIPHLRALDNCQF